MNVYLQGLASAVPDEIQTNESVVQGIAGWSAELVLERTGIQQRHVTSAGETAGDLAAEAAGRLLQQAGVPSTEIDAIVFCTQSPDLITPSTACLLQDRLQLPQTCAAFDVNLGCSGFTYGLWLSRALILSDSARHVLLLNGDTYSKYCNPREPAVAGLFGDGASAALITADPQGAWAEIGACVVGTNGRGAEHLNVRAGACRMPIAVDERDRYIHMNGAEIAIFAVRTVKRTIDELLAKAGLELDDIAQFVFHHASPELVRRLAAAYRLPSEKVPVDLADVGNIGGATIAMVLERCAERGALHPGDKVVLVGFGVGYSWGATLLEWMKPHGTDLNS
jgi:3-oxoacyl-[acyl-carrier-protein] synthase-3